MGKHLMKNGFTPDYTRWVHHGPNYVLFIFAPISNYVLFLFFIAGD